MDNTSLSYSEGSALDYDLRQGLLIIVSPEVGYTDSLVASESQHQKLEC
jgi:hypothetical protein